MENNQLIEDVEFVKHMIAKNRRALVDNGISYIATGAYVVVGVTLSYVMGALGKENWMPYLWLALMGVLIVVNIAAQRKIQQGRVKKTFATQIFSAVWLACGIPISIVSVLFFVSQAFALSTLLACVSACLGIGYYLTGVINDLRFMKILAAGWWAGVAVSLLWTRFFGQEYQLGLFFSLLILLLEIVPGVIIYKKWKLADHD